MVEDFKLFEGLEADEKSQLAGMFKAAWFDKKKSVKFSEESRDYIYLVRSGQLKVSYISPDGKEIIVAILKPGDVYSMHSEASAVTLEPTEIMYLESDRIREIILDKPCIAVNLVHILGNVLKNTNDVLLNLAFKEVNSRLATLILKLARENGVAPDEAIPFNIDLTHEEIANLISSTRQTVTTILNRFEKSGLIELGRKTMLIKDAKKLKELAHSQNIY